MTWKLAVLPRLKEGLTLGKMRRVLATMVTASVGSGVGAALAGVGDPQVATDHPWYPGELACSKFERLFATQAQHYERVTGRRVESDEDKALAAWLWRNTHYFHGEEGVEDWWGQGFGKGGDSRSREYWTGMFAHGFGLCGTTHAQWVPEMQALFGHNRGRAVGTAGHNSFEVFLTGGKYGEGRWAMLDHDLSTVAFDEDGQRLLSIAEVYKDWKRLLDPKHKPERQHGWPICGLHRGDAGALAEYNVAEYFAGYAGVPPMVHLRRGETLRRYLEPGLEDGKTFVFWGRNYRAGEMPGPERSLTWVNQPEKLFGAIGSAPQRQGQARYGNAVYIYRPNFANGDYREGVVSEDVHQVTFEFQTPYIIGATPPNNEPWGIYDQGGRNGLVLRGTAGCAVMVSVDRGQTWKQGGVLNGELDLTDLAKGYRQYLLRFHAGAKALAKADLTITTVCQANPSTMPRLKDSGTTVNFEARGAAVVSAGPTLPQAAAHVVEGAMATPKVTLQLESPRGEPVLGIHAAAHVQSGNPPDQNIRYRIEYSTDAGETWSPIVKDWQITRRGDEPKDFWSQSMYWGSHEFTQPVSGPIQVRFSNDGGRKYSRCEAHLVYRAKGRDGTKVTFAWSDERGQRQESHTFAPGTKAPWKIQTANSARTRWVEFEPVAR